MNSTASDSFCSELQDEGWSFAECAYEARQTRVVLERGARRTFPDPVGRPGHLVMAEPDMFVVKQTVEITFEVPLWFQVTREHTYVERDPEAKFDGRYFRCYSRSGLLAEQQQKLPADD